MTASPDRAVDRTASTGFVYGHPPAIQGLNAIVEEVARTNIPVLLTGESGTGKEVYGRLIHRLSKNRHRPLKKLSCRALEPGEFFAQLKSDWCGDGNGGEDGVRTVFLDGIEELDPACQRFLLSLLPDGDSDDLQGKPEVGPELPDEPRSFSLKVAARAASRKAERDLISQALERTRWNRKRAARDLQISYKSLLYKIKQTGLDGKQRERG